MLRLFDLWSFYVRTDRFFLLRLCINRSLYVRTNLHLRNFPCRNCLNLCIHLIGNRLNAYRVLLDWRWLFFEWYLIQQRKVRFHFIASLNPLSTYYLPWLKRFETHVVLCSWHLRLNMIECWWWQRHITFPFVHEHPVSFTVLWGFDQSWQVFYLYFVTFSAFADVVSHQIFLFCSRRRIFLFQVPLDQRIVLSTVEHCHYLY